MLSKKMQDALNGQLNAELYSSYLYLSMAADFEAKNLPGMANWMHVQAGEETMHAMKFFSFILARGGRVALTTIEGPETKWESPRAAFKAANEHEQKVTALINALVKLAREAGDPATDIFLQWFVTEQVEEEKSTDEVVQKLTMIEGAPQMLLLIDKELGMRQAAPAPATGGTTEAP